MTKTTLTAKLAGFFLSLKTEDLPPEVKQKTRELITDTIGVALAGSVHDESRPVLEIVLESGGDRESTIWGYPEKAPSHMAAMVNGTFTHCIEMDDTHRTTYLHAGACVLPAALAIGEKEGAGGKDLLFAVAAGYEATIRTALSVSPEHRLKGFHTTATVGGFGAAMASSLLMNLDVSQMVNAMGLAGTQAAGLFQFLYDGSMAKRFHPGRSAQSGILAALLASKGFTGSPEILEGDYGFGKVMSDRFDPDTVSRRLGNRWHILEMGIKPYSACRFCHAPIEAALKIRKEPGFDPSKIKSIEVYGSKQLFEQTGNQNPKTVMAAQLSTPFSAALALATGGTMPEDVEKGLNDPEIIDLARRVYVMIDDSLPQTARDITLKANTISGGEKRVSIELPLGEPERPIPQKMLRNKFLHLSGPVLGKRNSENLYNTLMAIDEMDDLEALYSALAP